MTDRKKVYWDACAWLGLLNGEAEKAQELEVVWEKAKHGEIEIWTSAFCIAEVYKVKCEGEIASLAPENDDKIDALFNQDWVYIAQVDLAIARLAKTLLRSHAKLKKPSDGIHLATAIHWNADQLHTWDASDLLGIFCNRADGEPLEICKPSMIDGENLFTKARDVSNEG
ncbi:MAG: PIN domain-containing protein [Acetobacteraceae bacterium]|nr:PIN domain-containing protein [Acetobacteraceae bacterium]